MGVSRHHVFSVAAAGTALLVGAGISPSNDFSLAAPAHAQTQILPSQVQPGDCMSKADMLDGFDKEGQYILVLDDAIAYDKDNGHKTAVKEVFSGNTDLSNGYQFVSSGPNGTGEYCKTTNIFNIKLLNPTLGSPDLRAFVQPVSNTERGTLNHSLQSVYEKAHELPILQYQTYSNDGRRQLIMGTITGQYPGQVGSGSGIVSTVSGKMGTSSWEIKNVQLTPTALKTIKAERMQTAGSSRK